MDERSTLRDLIELGPDDLKQALVEQARDEPALDTVKNIGGFLASVGSGEINKVLEQDPFELLAAGWVKLGALREAAAASERTPGQPIIVRLGKHDVTAPCHPRLTLYCDGAPLGTLRFTLDLTARFKSVALAIADGRLRSVAPGEASALVRLKYKSVQLREQSTPEWRLPGSIAFQAGLPIPH